MCVRFACNFLHSAFQFFFEYVVCSQPFSYSGEVCCQLLLGIVYRPCMFLSRYEVQEGTGRLGRRAPNQTQECMWVRPLTTQGILNLRAAYTPCNT